MSTMARGRQLELLKNVRFASAGASGGPSHVFVLRVIDGVCQDGGTGHLSAAEIAEACHIGLHEAQRIIRRLIGDGLVIAGDAVDVAKAKDATANERLAFRIDWSAVAAVVATANRRAVDRFNETTPVGACVSYRRRLTNKLAVQRGIGRTCAKREREEQDQGGTVADTNRPCRQSTRANESP